VFGHQEQRGAGDDSSKEVASRKQPVATGCNGSIVRVRDRGVAGTGNTVNDCSGAVSDCRNAGQRISAYSDRGL